MSLKKLEKKFKILSIDFDYFQDTSVKAVTQYYPDGMDLPPEIALCCWSQKYSKHYVGYEDVMKVKINEKLFGQLKRVISSQNPETPVVIQGSHLKIWNEITYRVPEDKDIFLSHIDFHDDFTNGNEKHNIVDCGNWLYWVLKYYDTKVQWYTRSVSFDCYGITQEEVPAFIDDLSELLKLNLKYDLVFICRSDIWTPPHLDGSFEELVELCNTTFYNVYVADEVASPRSMDELISAAEAIDMVYQQYLESKEGDI